MVFSCLLLVEVAVNVLQCRLLDICKLLYKIMVATTDDSVGETQLVV